MIILPNINQAKAAAFGRQGLKNRHCNLLMPGHSIQCTVHFRLQHKYKTDQEQDKESNRSYLGIEGKSNPALFAPGSKIGADFQQHGKTNGPRQQ